jgi:6,7-dimethyl-8-ribityllumazine synthase
MMISQLNPHETGFQSSSAWQWSQTQRLKIAIITAMFNSEITQALEKEAKKVLEALPHVKVQSLDAPGAVELPLLAQHALNTGADAVICLGCVIRGDTTHYDYVCSMTAQGIMQVSLQSGKPVMFGVLTCENEAQAIARTLDAVESADEATLTKLKGLPVVGNKGREAAEAVLQTLYSMDLVNLTKATHS